MKVRNYILITNFFDLIFILQIDHRYLQAANVGDSTAFLKRGNQVICLSEDHKPTSENESKRVRELGVVDLPKGASRLSGLAVSRAMGDFFFKQMNTGLISEPYVSPLFELQQEDDILIIASDGVMKTNNFKFYHFFL